MRLGSISLTSTSNTNLTTQIKFIMFKLAYINSIDDHILRLYSDIAMD